MNQLNNFRDTAIQKIGQGKQQYLQGATYEAKQAGYNLFKQGILELNEYQKMETNAGLKQMTVQKIEEYFKEAQNMKNYLQSNQPEQGQQGASANKSLSSSSNSQGSTPNQSAMQRKIKQTEGDDSSKLKANLESAIVTEKPNVKWDDVAGLENAKKSLQEAVIMPIRFPEIFQGARKPWLGILLYGPPGTGKTFLAQACATECDGTFFSVSSSDLISKFVGESERLIKSLFQMAREKKPSIIFIDEVDSMTGNRDGNETEASRRVKTEFLVQMQGVGSNNEGVLVLGATNLPWALDPAIRRRFEKRIYIPLPDETGRRALLQNRLHGLQCQLTNQDIEELVQALNGYSGSDMNTLIRDASFEPLRKCERATHFKQVFNDKNEPKWTPCSPSDPQGKPMRMMDLQKNSLWLPPVEMDDFLAVIPRCKPSVGKGDLTKYVSWTEEFGQDG